MDRKWKELMDAIVLLVAAVINLLASGAVAYWSARQQGELDALRDKLTDLRIRMETFICELNALHPRHGAAPAGPARDQADDK